MAVPEHVGVTRSRLCPPLVLLCLSASDRRPRARTTHLLVSSGSGGSASAVGRLMGQQQSKGLGFSKKARRLRDGSCGSTTGVGRGAGARRGGSLVRGIRVGHSWVSSSSYSPEWGTLARFRLPLSGSFAPSPHCPRR